MANFIKIDKEKIINADEIVSIDYNFDPNQRTYYGMFGECCQDILKLKFSNGDYWHYNGLDEQDLVWAKKVLISLDNLCCPLFQEFKDLIKDFENYKRAKESKNEVQ